MFSRLLNIGITQTTDPYQKRETRVLNIIALILLFGLLIGATNILFIGSLYPYVFSICVAIGTLLILFLNHKKLYTAALYCFIFTLVSALIYASNYYPRSVGTMVYFFPVIFSVALIHNPNKTKYHLAIKMAVILIAFLVSQLIQLPFITPGEFNAEQLRILRYYNLYFSIFVTVVLVFLSVKQITRQYNELNLLVRELEDNQVVISNSLKEKEVLLREIQHRVKNNLSVIIGLFNFQSDASNNPETKMALHEAKNRVLSIAMVQNQLHAKDNFSRINLKTYITELIQELLRSNPGFSHTHITLNLEGLNLDISKSIPLGLIINEVVTNSFKHGLKGNKSPGISAKLFSENGTVNLIINDNGIGFPPRETINRQSLGLSLIEALADQIDGKVSFNSKEGAEVILTFPLN